MVERYSRQMRTPASGRAIPGPSTARAFVVGAVAFGMLLAPASRILGAAPSPAGDPLRAKVTAPSNQGTGWQEHAPGYRYDAGSDSRAASPPAIRVHGIQDSGLRTIAMRVLNTVADDAERRLWTLPAGLVLEATSCGPAPEHLAYWDRARTTVVLCSELIEELQKAEAIHKELNAERHLYARENQALIERYVGYDAAESVLFVAYHELGHALIDMYDLGVPGNEEHAADAFATWWTIEGGTPHVAVQGALTFEQFGMIEAQDPSVYHSELHGPSTERYQNIACLLVGSGRQVPAYFERDVRKFRPSSCEAEYRRLDQQWSRLLSPHLRY